MKKKIDWNIVKDKLDIENELDLRGIDYKPVDRDEILIKCPIHNDSDYAFRIIHNPEHEKFTYCHCFACGYGGSFFKLISDLDEIPISEVLSRYDGKITPKEISKMRENFFDIFKDGKLDLDIGDKKDKVYKKSNLKNFTTDYSKRVLKYLKSRKLNKEICSSIGIMEDKRKTLKSGKKNLNFGKIVFIYKDVDGDLRGFGFRHPRKIKEDEIKVFKKPGSDCSETLFGFYRLKKLKFFGKNYIILVEGEFDAAYLQLLGYPAVSIGTKFPSAGQLAELRKYLSVDRIKLLLDSDVEKEDLFRIKSMIKLELPLKKLEIIKIYEDEYDKENPDPNNLGKRDLKRIIGD